MKMSRSNQRSGKRCKYTLTGLFDAVFKYFINIDDNLAHSYNQKGSELLRFKVTNVIYANVIYANVIFEPATI